VGIDQFADHAAGVSRKLETTRSAEPVSRCSHQPGAMYTDTGCLRPVAPDRVCLTADSTAAELVGDLPLVDFLLTESFATQVDLHLPPHP
jgi:hypothetical protein